MIQQPSTSSIQSSNTTYPNSSSRHTCQLQMCGSCPVVRLTRSDKNVLRAHLCPSQQESSCQVFLYRSEDLSSYRIVVPDPSPAFRETIERMRVGQTRTPCHHCRASCDKENSFIPPVPQPPSPVSSPTSTSHSFLHKLKSAFKSTSSCSPHRSSSRRPERSHSSAPTCGGIKCGSSRRPASFGGADTAKPWVGRRASQSEKRVSWADERGKNQALFSVRVIKPRLSADSRTVRQTTPGHSILRNKGLH